MIFHSKVTSKPLELNSFESLREEISNVHLGVDVADSDLLFLDVVADLEIARSEVSSALRSFRVVDREYNRLIVHQERNGAK